jgi:hypothetical protein
MMDKRLCVAPPSAASELLACLPAFLTLCHPVAAVAQVLRPVQQHGDRQPIH